jgi:hypothetical protein
LHIENDEIVHINAYPLLNIWELDDFRTRAMR